MDLYLIQEIDAQKLRRLDHYHICIYAIRKLRDCEIVSQQLAYQP
jgi:hypothetical protein